MTRIIFFLFSYFYLISAHAFEPSSGLVCKNLKSNYSVEFLFKKNNKTKIVKAFKRTDGQFIEIGNVVGKKLSSFIIFEDLHSMVYYFFGNCSSLLTLTSLFIQLYIHLNLFFQGRTL